MRVRPLQEDLDVVIGRGERIMSQLLLDILYRGPGLEADQCASMARGMHLRGAEVLLADVGNGLGTKLVSAIPAVAPSWSQSDPERCVGSEVEFPTVVAAQPG